MAAVPSCATYTDAAGENSLCNEGSTLNPTATCGDDDRCSQGDCCVEGETYMPWCVCACLPLFGLFAFENRGGEEVWSISSRRHQVMTSLTWFVCIPFEGEKATYMSAISYQARSEYCCRVGVALCFTTAPPPRAKRFVEQTSCAAPTCVPRASSSPMPDQWSATTTTASTCSAARKSRVSSVVRCCSIYLGTGWSA